MTKQRLTKEMYNAIQEIWDIKKRKKEEILKYFDYKKYFKNLNETKDFLLTEKSKINKKRMERQQRKYQFEKIDYSKKLIQIKEKLFENVFESYNCYNNGQSVKHVETDKIIKDISETYDYDYYSKSYGHPKKWTSSKINLDVTKIKLAEKDLLKIDNIINIEILSKKKFNNIIFLHTRSAKFNKYKKFDIVKYYIVYDGSIAYHSEKSVKHAFAGYQRKMKKIAFEQTGLTLDTEITRSIYAKITGACKAGIEEFCIKNGLENKKKMKLSELLPFIKNEYGYEKITALLNN
jgi:hypothetical protein